MSVHHNNKMRVSVRTILPQISKLTSVLNRTRKNITMVEKLHTFCVSRHHKHRLCLLHQQPIVSQCNAGHYFSTENITFDNQPQSWLFVSDAVAGAYGAQVNLELDLDKRLTGGSLEKLKSNLKMRGMKFDIDGLVDNFREFQEWEKRRSDIEAEKSSLYEEIKLLRDKDQSEDVKQSLKILFEKMSQLKKDTGNSQAFWEIECKVMHSALKLPNDLHDSTPVQDDLVIREVKGEMDCSSCTQSHVEIAKKFDLIKFSNVGPKAYYLKRELVLAEMALINSACSYLESRSYRHIAGPEFFKTPIMEGCGLDVHNPHEVLTLLNNSKDLVEPMNHLAGVSLPTFSAFVAKTCIGDNILPFNMFSCGRCYQNGILPGLFGAVQSTQATLFSCVKPENLDNQFHEMVDVIWSFLEPFGFPLRILQIRAGDLRREESRRFEIQMFSPGLQHFVPVAHVSDLSDFVSRRLMVSHNQNHADIRSASRVHMVSGSLINITSLLAIWMEYSNLDGKTFSLRPLKSVQKL